MIFYCGLSSENWNGLAAKPGEYVCVSPVSGSGKKQRFNYVGKLKNKRVILDSGAFSDRWKDRLSFSDAFKRQTKHIKKCGYLDGLEYIASYDLLIDEMWIDNESHRVKRRWSVNDAWEAVEETVNSAKWIKQNYYGPCVLSAQGVTPLQYLECSKRITDFIEPSDCFGFGGWCISGMMKVKMMPTFCNTVKMVIPMLAGGGVKRVHIWGVVAHEFLGRLLWMCDNYGLVLSTDSTSPQLSPTRGDWGYKGWPNRKHKKVKVKGNRLSVSRSVHVCQTRHYLQNELRNTVNYTEPEFYGIQEEMF